MPRLSKAGRKAFKARETAAAAALRESLAEVILIRVPSRGIFLVYLRPCAGVCVCVREREGVLVF